VDNGGHDGVGKALQPNMVTSRQHIKLITKSFAAFGCASSTTGCVVYVHGMMLMMDTKAKEREGSEGW
jgi:hypothetical protein